MAEINVTPMVDVMLVLLIIFMVVTPTLLAGFNAQLPVGRNLKERPDEENRTVLGIDVQGNYYLNKRPIAKADASQLLAREFERHPDDKVLFVKADRKLRYGEIMAAMDIARDAGARVVAAVTDPAPNANGSGENR
jgi:biopolymer transport protein ExbD